MGPARSKPTSKTMTSRSGCRTQPPPPRPDGMFTKDCFTVDLDNDTVTCPAGLTVSIRRGANGDGIAYFAEHCTTCPLRGDVHQRGRWPHHLHQRPRSGTHPRPCTTSRSRLADRLPRQPTQSRTQTRAPHATTTRRTTSTRPRTTQSRRRLQPPRRRDQPRPPRHPRPALHTHRMDGHRVIPSPENAANPATHRLPPTPSTQSHPADHNPPRVRSPLPLNAPPSQSKSLRSTPAT